MRKSGIYLVFIAALVSSCAENGGKTQAQVAGFRVGEIELPVVKEPVFPDYSVSITDFGAVSDGQTLNTRAITNAIEEVSKKGGGKVVIPRGLWLTGPITLKSNINIFTEEGALVIFSADKNLYPLIETSFEGRNTFRCISPIYGKDLENIALTGKGIFDGTGQVWRPVKKEKLTANQWKTLVRSGGIVSHDGKTWYPSISYMEGQKISSMNVPDKITSLKDFEKIKDFLRPVMVSLVNCKKVLLDGPGFQNSPAWCLHPLLCEDLTIRNITVKNPWYSQNGDGIDIESCKNTVVLSSNFDVGDDAICIKSGKDAEGRKRARPTENLVIKNCIVYHGHGGVTVGSEMSGGVRNVYVFGCTFMGTDVGLRFKSNRGRGGIVENMLFENIYMTDIPAQAVSFNLYYAGTSPTDSTREGLNSETTKEEVPPISEGTPVFRNITMKNITCKGADQAAWLQGLPEQNLQNIILENIVIEADKGLTTIDASGISIKNLCLITKVKTVVDIEDSQNIEIQNLYTPGAKSSLIKISGKKSKEITIKYSGPANLMKTTIGSEVDTSTIKIN
jgi:polygalacturonase